MIIRNSIIITSEKSPLKMRLDELPNFSGNIVFSSDRFDSDTLTAIKAATGWLAEMDAAPANLSRMTMKPELIG